MAAVGNTRTCSVQLPPSKYRTRPAAPGSGYQPASATGLTWPARARGFGAGGSMAVAGWNVAW